MELSLKCLLYLGYGVEGKGEWLTGKVRAVKLLSCVSLRKRAVRG